MEESNCNNTTFLLFLIASSVWNLTLQHFELSFSIGTLYPYKTIEEGRFQVAAAGLMAGALPTIATQLLP